MNEPTKARKDPVERKIAEQIRQGTLPASTLRELKKRARAGTGEGRAYARRILKAAGVSWEEQARGA